MNADPRYLASLLATVAWAATGVGATPSGSDPIESFLPPDTLAAVVLPQGAATEAVLKASALGELWRDPALLSLRASLGGGRFQPGTGTPIPETQATNAAAEVAPVRSGATADLPSSFWFEEAPKLLAHAQGPAVMALQPERGAGQAEPSFAVVALLRAGTRVPELRHYLQELELRWTNFAFGCSPCLISGTRALRLDLPLPAWLRGSTATVSFMLGHRGAGAPGSTPVFLTETNGVLAAATSTNSLAALLERVQGRLEDSLAQTPGYRDTRPAGADDAFLRAWLNLEPLVAGAFRLAEAADRATNARTSTPLPSRTKLLEATGLTGLRSISASLELSQGGTRLETRLNIPEERRTGLLQAMTLPPSDAAPGAEVPGDLMRFERLRLDGRHAWTTLERMVTGVFPQAASVLDLLFKTAGPGGQGGDLKTDLLAALGNDLVLHEWAPWTNSSGAAVRAPPPRLYRYTTERPEQLTRSLKALSVFLPPPLSECRDETLGDRAGFSLTLAPVEPSLDASLRPRLYAGPGSNFVAFATDRNLLTQALTNALTPVPRPLRERDGVATAASHVGGMGTGWFGCVDLTKWTEWKLRTWHSETNLWGTLLDGDPSGLAATVLQPLLPAASLEGRSLPAPESLGKHLDLAVYSGGADPDGFFFRLFVSKPAARK